jgi:hypothetical protein
MDKRPEVILKLLLWLLTSLFCYGEKHLFT